MKYSKSYPSNTLQSILSLMGSAGSKTILTNFSYRLEPSFYFHCLASEFFRPLTGLSMINCCQLHPVDNVMLPADTNRMISELRHDELIPFLQKQISWRTLWGRSYLCINIVLIGLLPYFAFIHPGSSNEELILNIGLGFCLFFLLLPLHEIIHGLVYRMLGAKKVIYKFMWRKMVFYAVADRFIVNRKQFNLVALAPFVLINAVLLIVFFMVPSPANLVFYGALLLHTGGCFGDFALISYMHQYRNLTIATMDDAVEERTYFFEQT